MESSEELVRRRFGSEYRLSQLESSMGGQKPTPHHTSSQASRGINIDQPTYTCTSTNYLPYLMMVIFILHGSSYVITTVPASKTLLP